MSAATDRWAAQPGPHKVLSAVRELLQDRRTGNGVTVRVELTAIERAQVARYLGVAWDTSGQPVTLGKLRTALTRTGDDLLDLLTRTGGAIDDVRGRREQAAARTAATIDAAYTSLTTTGLPDHAVQLARKRRWLGTDPDTATRRSDDLQHLWHALPGTGRPLLKSPTPSTGTRTASTATTTSAAPPPACSQPPPPPPPPTRPPPPPTPR